MQSTNSGIRKEASKLIGYVLQEGDLPSIKKLFASHPELLKMHLKGLDFSSDKDVIVDVLSTIGHLCSLDQTNDTDIFKTCIEENGGYD